MDEISSIFYIIINMIRPPFNYTGNKNRLIDEFSDKYFLKEKDVNFLDVFGGGATISLNVNYNNITYNDISFWVPPVMKIFKSRKTNSILNDIKSIINNFNLSSTHYYGQNKYRLYREGNNGLKNINKNGFYKLRDDINKDILSQKMGDLFYIKILVLTFYSFNNDMRFNSKGLVNIPIGKTDFNSQTYDKVVTFSHEIKKKKIRIVSKDFRKINFNDYNFIYLDPPYLISNAVYNNNWNEKDEIDLYNKLVDFDKKGGKFVLSNLIFSKGKNNDILIKYSKNNTWKIKDIRYSYKAASYNRDRESLDQEVIVTNV